MCVPISVVTGGKISGCQGICSLWPHISGLVVLSAGLILTFCSNLFSRGKNHQPA